MKAIVVFHGFEGGARHPLGWMLKRGFRHCFVCVLADEMWLRIDGAIGVPVFEFLTAGDFDLAAYYRDAGLVVVETEQRDRPVLAPFMMPNCVGMVKAALCIRAPWAFTPWRLYRALT